VSKPRDQSGGVHHVVCRGNNKRPVFESAGDRAWFLHLFNETARAADWSVHGYALMTNHYHLILGIEDGALGDPMCELNTGYATWFNRKNGRINHLFGRRYWNELLADEHRYFAALRYVIRNPTRAGIPGPLTSHTWTSYPASLGLDDPPIRLARDDLFRMFDPRPTQAVFEYRQLCESFEGPAYSRAAVRGRPPRQRTEMVAASITRRAQMSDGSVTPALR